MVAPGEPEVPAAGIVTWQPLPEQGTGTGIGTTQPLPEQVTGTTQPLPEQGLMAAVTVGREPVDKVDDAPTLMTPGAGSVGQLPEHGTGTGTAVGWQLPEQGTEGSTVVWQRPLEQEMVTTTSMGWLVVVVLGQGSVSAEVNTTGPGVEVNPVDSGHGSVKVLVTRTERVAEVALVTAVDSAILVTVLLGSEKVT